MSKLEKDNNAPPENETQAEEPQVSQEKQPEAAVSAAIPADGGASLRRPGAANAFQPDAVEIEENPVAPGPRWTLYAIASFLLIGIIWAAVGQIDKIVVATGSIGTTSQNIVVQPLETAVIREMPVQVGQVVKAGETLATLDATFAEADEVANRALLESVTLQVDRLEAELSGNDFRPELQSIDAQIQRGIFERRAQQFESELQATFEEENELEARLRTSAAEIVTSERQLEVIDEVVSIRRRLLAKEFGSRLQWLEAQNQSIALQRDIERMRNSQEETRFRIAQTLANRERFISNWRRDAAESLIEARRERDRLQEQLRKLERRSSLVTLAAPADAVVLEIGSRSVGSVIREAEPLFTLVPIDVPLQLEVDVLPRDIALIQVGDEARIKLEAMPFQRHGTLDATITVVSEDTITREVQGRQSAVYRAILEITSQELRNVPKGFRLLPGMQIMAEIHVGKRSILSYLLYPVLKGLDEGLREP